MLGPDHEPVADDRRRRHGEVVVPAPNPRQRHPSGGRNVTFPARQYAVNGGAASRCCGRSRTSAHYRLRDIILDAYREHEAAVEAASA